MVDRMPDGDVVSAEEWRVIHALRRLRTPIPQAAEGASQDDLESTYRNLESEILDNVGATLDRMIDRADRTSGDLDNLLRLLSETALSERPAA